MIDNTISPSIDDNPSTADWFDLSTEGRVLLRTGKVEIGQGILTALIQIAADELDIAPERFDVLSGHTALGPLEGQTSSSLSIEVTGRAVRQAASALRNCLAAEAAKLLQASADTIRFEDGRVFAGSRETPLSAWSLAGTAGIDFPVTEHALPKAIGERRVIGTSWPRWDLLKKASTSAFIQDLAPTGMLHGRVLQAPMSASRIEQFDEQALTARFPDITLVRDGSFIGVVAAREEIAVRAITMAADLASWRTPPGAPADLLTALAEHMAPVEEVLAKGDVDAADGKAVNIQVRRGFVAHGSIAPSCALAVWEAGKLTVYSHTQNPHGTRDALAKVFDLHGQHDVTVIYTPSAGTYGHSGQDDVTLDAALLAQAVDGAPVRVVWARADEFRAAPLGPGMVVDGTARVDASGKLTSIQMCSTSQPHAQRPGREGLVAMLAAERLSNPFPIRNTADVPIVRGGGAERNAIPLYNVANVNVTKRIAMDLPSRTSALRGLGAPVNVFALEALMDEAALAANVDPLQFRLAHLDDARARDVISRAAELAGWPGETSEGEALGIGFAQYKNRSAYSAVVVRVSIDEHIRVTHAWAAVDAGEAINPNGLHAQVEGGIIQATSWTLKEAVQYNGGTVTTERWDDYPILKFSEVPEIVIDVLDRPDEKPLGAGETSVGPTSAAIGNAVRRALGTRVTELPITRDAIVRAVG